jgi:hypothetical protein
MTKTPTNPQLYTARPEQLNTYVANPRRGDLAAIEGSLIANGQYKPVTVNKGTHTGRPLEVLGGNHTVIAIRNLRERYPADERWHVVYYTLLDVDEDAARRIVIADNRIGQLGGFDDVALAELLGSLVGTGLDGTGYTDGDYDDLVATLQETEDDFGENPFGPVPGAPDYSDGRPSHDGPTGNVGRPIHDPTKTADYSSAATRIIVLSLPIPQYVWANRIMEQFRRELGVSTNSALLLKVLEEWAKERAPEPDATITTELAAEADAATLTEGN